MTRWEANLIKKLGISSLTYGVGTLFAKSINLFMLPIFTAYLTPKEYGIISMLLLFSMLIQPVFSLGLNVSMGICYFENDSIKEKSKTVFSSFLLLFFSSTLLFILIYFFAHDISKLIFHTDKYSRIIIFTGLMTLISIISTPFMLRIQFEQEAKLFVIISTVATIFTVSLSSFFIIYQGLNIEGMILGQLLGQSMLLLLFGYFGTNGLALSYSIRAVKKLLVLGLPIIPSSFFLLILLQSNRYILEYFEGLESVGIYSIGFNIGMMMSVLVGGFSQAWYSFFMSYSNKQEQIGKTFSHIMELYLIVFGSITIIFFIFSNGLILLLASPQYHDAYLIVGFVALSQLFIGIFSILTPAMYYTQEVKYVSIWQGIAASISIPINIILIYWLGLLGAGIGLALSTAVMPLLQLIWNKYRHYSLIEYTSSNAGAILLIIAIFTSASFINNGADVYEVLLLSISMLGIFILLLFMYFYKNKSYYTTLYKVTIKKG